MDRRPLGCALTTLLLIALLWPLRDVEGGERLIHIEVGWEGEAEVQGLGADAGAMSFFLPDGGDAGGGGRCSLRVVTPPWAVKRGSELKRAFRFCPYQYYGRLSSFRRALCQDSWERWYYKQWQIGSIYDKWAALYNQTAELALAAGGAPSMFLKGSNLLLHGFERLEGTWIKEMADFAQAHPWKPAGSLSPLPPPPQEILQALTELVEALDDPDFARRVAEVEGKYPLFAELLEDLAWVTQEEKVSLARGLAELAQQDGRFDELWARFGRLMNELEERGIIDEAVGEELPATCCSPEWRWAAFMALSSLLLVSPEAIDINQQLVLQREFEAALFLRLQWKQLYLSGEPDIETSQICL